MGIIELDETKTAIAKIKVVGVGGAGGNALNCMADNGLEGVELIAINTDAQALDDSRAHIKFPIGELGAGGDPEMGRAAIEERREELKAVLAGANMIFITAGMGGGTGTGAAPVVAEVCRELGILTVAVVTKPFMWEQAVRKRNAASGLYNISTAVDTLITINNQNVLSITERNTTFYEAMQAVDTVLKNAVKGVTDIIFKHGYVNVDFADIRTVMRHGGDALMGLGEAEGDNRAYLAVERALESPLLDDIDVKGATGLLINICADYSLTMVEVNEVMSCITEQVGEGVETATTFGAVIDEAMGGKLAVTIIATGFDAGERVVTPKPVERRDEVVSLPSPRVTEPEKQLATQEPEVDLSDDFEEPFRPSRSSAETAVQPTLFSETSFAVEIPKEPGFTQSHPIHRPSFSGFQPPPAEEDARDIPAFLRYKQY